VVGLVFVKMAVRNVARNWNRTGLMIAGMAVAAAMMTVTTALSAGYAEGAAVEWRQLVGADILVYADLYAYAGDGEESGSWQWRSLPADFVGDAVLFRPDLERGYLSPSPAGPDTFGAGDFLSVLDDIPGVADVQPARLLPAYVAVGGPGAGSRRIPVVLRGRSIAGDLSARPLPDVPDGRYFNPSDDGRPVALVNRHGPVPANALSDGRLLIEVPTAAGWSSDGLPVLDHSRTLAIELEVLGRFSLSLGPRVIVNLAQGAGPETEARPMRKEVYIDVPEVWVPAATFDLIYEDALGRPLERASQLCLNLESMFLAKDIAQSLAEVLPGRTVVTVPQEVAASGIQYVPYRTGDPPVVVVRRVYYPGTAVTMDIKAELSGAAFGVAGLLVVANMYVLVTQRRREIGVLKAVGAASRDIVLLILVEAVGYSLVGAGLGFLAVRLVTFLPLLGSATSLVEGTALTVRAGLLVVGLTTGVSLLFGVLPALDAARTSVVTLLGDQ